MYNPRYEGRARNQNIELRARPPLYLVEHPFIQHTRKVPLA